MQDYLGKGAMPSDPLRPEILNESGFFYSLSKNGRKLVEQGTVLDAQMALNGLRMVAWNGSENAVADAINEHGFWFLSSVLETKQIVSYSKTLMALHTMSTISHKLLPLPSGEESKDGLEKTPSEVIMEFTKRTGKMTAIAGILVSLSGKSWCCVDLMKRVEADGEW